MPLRFSRAVHHDTQAPSLELHNVTVYYDGTRALEDVSFQVQQGEQVAVVGPNGAGKSTLFNVIAGIVKPQSGQVRVYGSGPRGHICVGYVPQRRQIDWRFPVSVADVVMMGRTGKIGLFRLPGREDHRQVEAALEQVGIGGLARRQIGELSGGQQQRVFLARALAQEAELLLLDEPLAGLDIPSEEAILQILSDLRNRGITIMIATHDLNQARERFSRLMLLNQRLIAYGSAEEVLTPEALGIAYGNQLHVMRNAEGDLIVTDTCCGGGHLPVPPLVGAPLSGELDAPASSSRPGAGHLATGHEDSTREKVR